MRLASATLSCCLLAGLASAQTQLFVAEYEYQHGRIAAVGVDGSNPHTLIDLPESDWLPIGLTYNTQNGMLYWTDGFGTSRVLASATNGSNYGALTTAPGFTRGASLDATGRIYFGSDQNVYRCDDDGSNLTPIFTGASGNPVGDPRVDAVNGHVYVGADGQIVRFDLDGGNVKVVVNGVSQPRAICLDVGNNAIYWIDSDTHTDFIGRARLDGSGFTIVTENSPGIVQSPGLSDLALLPETGQLFYSDELRGDVTRVEADGSNPVVIYQSPVGKAPSGLVLSIGEPQQATHDLNRNSIADDTDIAGGEPDCDNNGVPDIAQSRACILPPVLADQGSNAISSSGRALGIPSQWQIFQPFDVPAGGWTVGSIGLDGYTSAYYPDTGITLRLFPDNGTGNAPDETTPIASAHLSLYFNTNLENWAYGTFDTAAALPPGRVWVRVEADDPFIYGASVNTGFSGLQSKSRGSSGNFTSLAAPIAMRLLGAVCPSDLNLDTTVDLADYFLFFNYFDITSVGADIDGNPGVDLGDFFFFLNAFDAGC